MKNMKIRLAITMAVVLGFAASVQAIQITGKIDMSGSATLNNVLLGSATAVTSFGPSTVAAGPTGSFVGTAGSAVAWNPFSWNPSAAVSPLWSFTSGLWTYKFNLQSVSVNTQNNMFLNLLGTGTLEIVGAGSPYTITPGLWSFTISNPTGGAHANYEFSFANSQEATVPDGGATAMLLGGALAGLAFLRRKLA